MLQADAHLPLPSQEEPTKILLDLLEDLITISETHILPGV